MELGSIILGGLIEGFGCTLKKKFSKNYHTSSKATTDCKNPKNYHTLQ